MNKFAQLSILLHVWESFDEYAVRCFLGILSHKLSNMAAVEISSDRKKFLSILINEKL